MLNKRILKVGVDLDFELIAIHCTLKDYRLCYLLNKHLKFNLSRMDDLAVDIYQNSTEPALFSLYHDRWENTCTDFYFIANRGSDGLLVPELRQADYFMLIRNFIDEDDLEHILRKLSYVPEIVWAIKIDPKKLKSNENLLF